VIRAGSKSPDESRLSLQKTEVPTEDPAYEPGTTARVVRAADIVQSLTGDRRTPADRATQQQQIGDIDATQPVRLAAGDTAQVRFKNGRVQLHPSWASTSLGAAMSGTTLDLNKVTADMLDALGPNQSYTFMHMLGSVTLEVERRDPDGKLLTGPGKSRFTKRLGPLGIEMLGKAAGTTSRENAAEAMARRVWASGRPPEVFARTFAAAPEYVLPSVQGKAARVLTTDDLTAAFESMLASRTAFGEPGMDPTELDGLGTLFAKFFERRVGSTPKKLEAAFRHLMAAFERSELNATPQTAGILTGAVIAGLSKALGKAYEMEKIKALVAGLAAANLWAATGFMGGLPRTTHPRTPACRGAA
jgi:hypothetical protein